MRIRKALCLVAICAPLLVWAQTAGGHFDGTWTTSMSCEASTRMPAYTWTFISTITNGNFHGQHGEEGGPGYLVVDGPLKDEAAQNCTPRARCSRGKLEL